MKKERGKVRSDHPSGRQAMEQPEHTKPASPARSSLHQGQGPDFQTQDETVNEHNPGVNQLQDGDPGPHQQAISAPPGTGDIPNKDAEEEN